MSAIGIYGAGGYGRSFLRAMREQGVEPDFFIDQYCSHREVEGLPVFRMHEVADRDARILVSIGLVPLASDPSTDILRSLHAAGFQNVVSFAESLNIYPGIVPGIFSLENLWMRSTPSKMLDEEKLSTVAALLSDDKSRDLLERIIAFRRAPSATTYVPPDGQLEYFPGDIDVFGSIDAVRFVDCGAYVGDTVAELSAVLAAKKLPFEYAVSFEPDPKNYQKLVAELAKQQAVCPATRFFACCQGVWSVNTALNFNADNTSSANVATASAVANGGTTIQVVSLDDMFGAAAPNFIKMDIEGAEREAILGARRLIADAQPLLAICVYHKPEDLWDLPLLISEINPNYDMHLRVHSHMGLSTVLYCVPR
ncbi:MAG: FkbM family methyltransferase [Sedimenticolaceae bacterium]